MGIFSINFQSILYYLGFVYTKNYLNLAKIFLLRLFKMAANQTALQEQRSVIKFLAAEKCKINKFADACMMCIEKHVQ